MTKKRVPPFERVELVMSPRLCGARWWQERMSQGTDDMSRRSALIGLVALGVGVTTAGAIILEASKAPAIPDDLKEVTKTSLEAQKELGWNVGAGTTSFPSRSARLPVENFDRSVLTTMVDSLSPTDERLRPFYVPTLFQSITAVPSAKADPDADPFKPLRDLIAPFRSPDTDVRFSQGRALASLFAGAPSGAPNTAVMIDLPGPEAVAFAAGLADALDIVFAFDGWPHPAGVVASNETLGAAAYYAPLLGDAKSKRARGLPFAIVLDRQRLARYDKSASVFDNRYVAKVPAAADFRRLGVTQIFYVSPNAERELDDLNEDFVAYAKADLKPVLMSPDDFISGGTTALATPPLAGVANQGASARNGRSAGGADGGSADADGGAGDYVASAGHLTYRSAQYDYAPYYYGGSPSTHFFFWRVYGWGPPRYRYISTGGSWVRPVYMPTLRSTDFHLVNGTTMTPSGFSQVAVMSSPSTGRTYSSGSWGRSSSGVVGS